MGYTFSIDFGTTNTVIARWDDANNAAEVLTVPGLSTQLVTGLPELIPSLVYVNDGAKEEIVAGQRVRDDHLDHERDNRLFRNFKRGIVSFPAPAPREIDGVEWADRQAGRSFIRHLISTLPYGEADIDQLVLTAPVASFEGYLSWLNGVIDEISTDKIRIVDESTAAALGYTITKPGAVVLVFDFGGGTLDLSLVQLPESREKTGGILSRLLRGGSTQHAAKVVAKAGRIIGGSDIDQWLLADILERTGLQSKDLGNDYASVLTQCEQAKILLSIEESASITFEAGGKSHEVTITRDELETLLENNGFYAALRRVVDKVMHVAHRRGIFKEDIHYVLMVGGTSLMPSVQRTLRQYFTEQAIYSDKPFTSVAEGALQVAAGYGLDDYLIHSYGIRYLESETNSHAYDEFIPMGTQYPTSEPIEIILGAAHENQQEVEFVIGEIDSDSVAMIEVQYENGQAVFVADANTAGQQIIPLNEATVLKMLAKLDPNGTPGEDRLKAAFTIDDRRQLRMTVTDLATKKTLLNDVVVTTLR
ncbi:MAG: Hsp70 family protein [Anaerolineaceae bacterium]|nr:Hsp70 family protein [Anaerolineaceae bacterium]